MKPPKQVDITPEELEGLIQRLDAEALRDDDLSIIKAIVRTYVVVVQLLRDKRATIKRLLRMVFGASTEKARTVLSKTAAAKIAVADREQKTAGKKRGHGRNGASAYTGAVKITVSHPTMKTGDLCPECARGKVYPPEKPGVVVRITGGAPLQSTIWELEKLRCNLCGEVFTAPLPAEAGTGKYDESAGAMIPLLRYGSGLPLNRIEQLQESMGSPVPSSTQWEITEKAANQVSPVHDELKRQAAQGEVVYNDDTTMKILAKVNREDEERTGTFTTGILSVVDDKKIVLFYTGGNHSGENMSDLLGQRDPQIGSPIQMCDALSRNTSGKFTTILGNCLAHARRNFIDVVENFPDECQHVIEALAEIYKNDKKTKKEMMSPLERLQYHQAHSGPAMQNLHLWMTDQLESRQVEPNSGLGKAISYMLKHWGPLTLFLRVEGAPLDNNICEQALKRAILHRRNSLFYKTLRGAQVGDIFMSLIHTCKLAKVNPFNYLVALQKHAQAVLKNPQKWLPWNYTEALAALSA